MSMIPLMRSALLPSTNPPSKFPLQEFRLANLVFVGSVVKTIYPCLTLQVAWRSGVCSAMSFCLNVLV